MIKVPGGVVVFQETINWFQGMAALMSGDINSTWPSGAFVRVNREKSERPVKAQTVWFAIWFKGGGGDGAFVVAGAKVTAVALEMTGFGGGGLLQPATKKATTTRSISRLG